MDAVNGLQCDTCRVFAPGATPPSGWLILFRQGEPGFSGMLSVLTGSGGGGAEVTGTFCGTRCLAEWAYVLLAAEAG